MVPQEITTADLTELPDPIKTVRDYYRLVDGCDVKGILALFEPDATYDRPGYDQLAGHAQIESFYRSQRVIESGRHTIAKAVREGLDVAVHGVFEGRLRGGGQVSLRFADFFTLTLKGTFARRRTFFYTPLV